MKYLTTNGANTGRTPVDVYIEKQTAWAEAQDLWDAAKIQAKSALHCISSSVQLPTGISLA